MYWCYPVEVPHYCVVILLYPDVHVRCKPIDGAVPRLSIHKRRAIKLRGPLDCFVTL